MTTTKVSPVAAAQVCLSTELMRLIGQFQDGVFVDMQPFVDLDVPRPWRHDESDHPTSRCRVDLLDDSFPCILDAANVALAPWLASYGFSRLDKLFGCLDHMRPLVMLHAISHANLVLLDFLDATFSLTSFHGNVIDVAAFLNQYAVLRFLHDHGHRGCTSDAMDHAARHGHLVMVDFLLAHYHCQSNLESALHEAILHGHVEVMHYLQDTTHVQLDRSQIRHIMCDIASMGHLAMLQLIFDPLVDSSEKVMHAAAGNGHLDIVQWLYSQNVRATSNTVAQAAHNGHLDVVRFLHQHQPSTCQFHHRYIRVMHFSEDYDVKPSRRDCFRHCMDIAAEHGYLKMVDYLGTHGGHWSDDVMDYTAKHGHLHVLQRLHHFHQVLYGQDGTNPPPCTTFAMDFAAANGHLNIVQWLHETFPQVGCSTAALDMAAGGNHMEVVQWLLAHRREGGSAWALDLATHGGHLEMLQYLTNTSYIFSADASGATPQEGKCGCGCEFKQRVELAAAGGHVDIIEWLFAQEIQPCETRAMDIAIAHGHVDLVRWLYHRRTSNVAANAIDCTKHGLSTLKNCIQIRWQVAMDNALSRSARFAFQLALNERHVKMIKWLLVHQPAKICLECVKYGTYEMSAVQRAVASRDRNIDTTTLCPHCALQGDPPMEVPACGERMSGDAYCACVVLLPPSD
ncbi:Aste57867_2277 [Aphanomyces stellatus]|uniref:Aste57867_2277 protein n=1 Tax=Aphanomyces stellatus TaxID=120398 RepID=A0A485KCV8_9STRA|nr:hypothetical protein As57867_002272 [Aphanomyces stellatus]VFT79480.1 Aste57867_2277 [Aphanomyces stellatus]